MTEKKRLLIVSYHFHPEISPRAFRATELAKELSKTYAVDVLTPVASVRSEALFQRITIPRGLRQSLDSGLDAASPVLNLKESPIKHLIRKLLHFILPGGLSTLFAVSILKHRHILKPRYDAIISIGLPLGSHVGSYILKRFYKFTDNLILDYGDPFLRNPKSHWSPFNYLLEKTLLDSANHVVVPVRNALPAFSGIAANKKMNVIPQGLDIENIQTRSYKKNEIPTVAYAGLFYKDIRDPESFLRRALSMPHKFKLIFLTDLKSPENLQLVEKYKKWDIHNRLEIQGSVPRNECISILSACDFLINFRNQSATQSPSKLIDYTLAKRPILEIYTDSEDVSIFEQFLNEDYSQAQAPIDLAEYDIRNVAKKFAALIEG